MKDDIREKLSAYLDGELSDSQRRAIEVEISRSEPLGRELEALRALSETVKGLGKEKLPEGFMARLQARRAREEAPARSGYRPLALALSTAVIALIVWDKARPPRQLLKPLPDWDGGGAIQSAAPAPASIAALEQPAEQKSAVAEESISRKKEDVAASQELDARPLGKKFAQKLAPESSLDLVRSLSAVRGKSASGGLAGRGAAAKIAATAAPIVEAVSLRSASALQSAWTAAGLTGKPPYVDFSAQMAIFLAGPQGCGIVSVQDHNTSIVVLYKDSGFSDAFSRVRAVIPSTKPITAKPTN